MRFQSRRPESMHGKQAILTEVNVQCVRQMIGGRDYKSIEADNHYTNMNSQKQSGPIINTVLNNSAIR